MNMQNTNILSCLGTAIIANMRLLNYWLKWSTTRKNTIRKKNLKRTYIFLLIAQETPSRKKWNKPHFNNWLFHQAGGERPGVRRGREVAGDPVRIRQGGAARQAPQALPGHGGGRRDAGGHLHSAPAPERLVEILELSQVLVWWSAGNIEMLVI